MEVIRLKSQVFLALEQITLHLRQKKITAWRRSVAKSSRLQEALRASTNGLWIVAAACRDATVATNTKITREIRSRLGHVAINLQRAQNTIMRLRSCVADQPRRLEESLQARENDLRKLLTSSPDAIVVVDSSRRFVEANPKGLDLFGVSDANMRKFTADTFLSRGQIPEFDGNNSPFRGRNANCGRCLIRRLNGSLRVAEYTYIPNFVPYRHLFMFRNVSATNQYRPAALRRR